MQVVVERFPPKRSKPLKRRKSKSKLSDKSDEDEEDTKNTKQEVTKSVFVCNRWLARSEDDGQIVRELVPTDEHGKVLRRNSLIGKEGKSMG